MIDKDAAIDALRAIDDEGSKAMEIAKLVAELKVTLLSDGPVGGTGGLSEGSRKRAWIMVNMIGKILLK